MVLRGTPEHGSELDNVGVSSIRHLNIRYTLLYQLVILSAGERCSGRILARSGSEVYGGGPADVTGKWGTSFLSQFDSNT